MNIALTLTDAHSRADVAAVLRTVADEVENGKIANIIRDPGTRAVVGSYSLTDGE